jgi:hypothetical protein
MYICARRGHEGCGHGTKMNKAFTLEKPMDLKKGVNHVAVLASSMGMTVGVDMPHRNITVLG